MTHTSTPETTITLTESALAALVANAVSTALAQARIAAPVALEAPAVEAVQAPAQAEILPVLTRSAWKTLRSTKSGTVRKAFAGLTREQAFEAGLCEGYRLPTGTMRAALATGI